jgi:hypothetical protein
MEQILKITSTIIALFIIANGVWVYSMPTAGDEPVAYAIIAIGIFIPVLTFYVARIEERQQ